MLSRSFLSETITVPTQVHGKVQDVQFMAYKIHKTHSHLAWSLLQIVLILSHEIQRLRKMGANSKNSFRNIPTEDSCYISRDNFHTKMGTNE